MSRSKKGKKAPGTEYWGSREITKGGPSSSSGTQDKRIGIQKERANSKRNLFKELMDGVKEMAKKR